MSSYQKSRMESFVAGADLSAKQFHAVKHGSADGEVVTAGAEEGFGILQNAPTSGKGAEVAMTGGGAKAVLAGTVTRGDSLKSDANGKFVVCPAGDKALCIAMASGVANDVIAVDVVVHSVPA